MKNIKKVLAVMTAVSAFAASSSAFAATTVGETDANSIVTFTKAAYTDGELTTGNSIAINAIPAEAVSGEVTLLMLDYDAVLTNVADGDILYIDQATYSVGTNPFADKALGLKVADIVKVAEDAFAADTEGTLTEKTYSFPVKLGYYIEGEFAIATASVDVTVAKDGSGDTQKSIKIIWGDVDADGVADTVDATNIMSAYVGGNRSFPTSEDAEYKYTWNSNTVTGTDGKTYTMANGYLWGDVDADGVADTVDATNIMSAYVGGNRSFPVSDPVYTWNDTENPVEIELTEVTE